MKEENIQEQPLSKKEKADIAGKDVAETAIRGAGRYYGGSVGGAAVDAALNTKMGQKGIARVSNKLNRNPVFRSALAKNQETISAAKPMVNSMISGMGKGGSASSSLENDSNISDNNANSVNSFDEGNSNISGDVSRNGKSKSIKTKLTIGFISSIFPIFISFLFLIIPLIALDIIDIDDIVNVGGSFTSNYSSISSSNTHWWPIGSSNTTNSNGTVYASNNPSWSKITSEYGMRVHPISKEYKMHGGVDIADGSDYGQTNVIAVKDGTVSYPSDSDEMDCPSASNETHSCHSSYGNYVVIEHNDGTSTVYAHLHQNTITVRAGDIVKQGQVIGKMGSSGSSTGTHLHFEVMVNGSKVNPLSYVSIDSPRPKSFTNYTVNAGN